MGHHFTIEDVFRNSVKVVNALRFIAAEITTCDVSEGVFFGSRFYHDNAFFFLKWRFVNRCPVSMFLSVVKTTSDV
jgi:hypothetical protein